MGPVYLQLKESLAQEIADGKVQPGDLLPSEADLMKAWSVSRITVRNAIKELVRDGVAYTLHGKGTFVAEQKITNYLPSLTSLSQDVAERGMMPGSRLLVLETVEADKDIASRLHISPGSPVIHFDRVTLADAQPISIGYTYVPVSAVVPRQDEFTPENLEDHSFYQLLRRLGITLTGGIQTISASGATPFEAETLGVPEGFSLIDSERVAYTKDRTFVEYTKMHARPDFIQWKIVLGPMD